MFVARKRQETKTEEQLSRSSAFVGSAVSLDVNPVTDKSEDNSPRLATNIKQPMPVPEAGIERSSEIMETGRLFRYGGVTANSSNADQVLDDVSLTEEAFARTTGHKYCVGLNSCGSAIFLALYAVLEKEKERLRTAGGDGPIKVLSNAFTFAAVPSAIVHAGCEPVYVNATDQYVIDCEDFERKAVASGAKIVIVSHMRGRLCNMTRVGEICKKHDITLIEDCAHSLGCSWNGVTSGASKPHGTIAACFSTQSNKMINSGEGGFLVTDDDEVATRAILAAGSYEYLYKSHSACPRDHSLFESLKHETPNFSLRMHQVTAAMIYPQIPLLEGRYARHRHNYDIVEKRLNEISSIRVPAQLEGAIGVGDSIQFNLKGRNWDQAHAFIGECAKRGVPMEIFGAHDNARNFKNWQFALPPKDCEPTYGIIEFACDLRLPIHLTEQEVHTICDVVHYSLEATA